MLIEHYFELLQAKLAEIAADIEPIQVAARMCADCLEQKGAIHIYDSGHMVSQELIHRAGGLAAFSALTFGLQVENRVRTRPQPPVQTDPLHIAYIQHIFDNGQLAPGDVLFVGSVSGKSANVVELALQAKARGLKVIAITALAYSSRLESAHPSGKRLFEAADLTLDNHAPYGDAMMTVEGMETPICPASGIGAASVLWAVTAGITELMLQRGKTPTAFTSVNMPGGPANVEAVLEEARKKGY